MSTPSGFSVCLRLPFPSEGWKLWPGGQGQWYDVQLLQLIPRPLVSRCPAGRSTILPLLPFHRVQRVLMPGGVVQGGLFGEKFMDAVRGVLALAPLLIKSKLMGQHPLAGAAPPLSVRGAERSATEGLCASRGTVQDWDNLGLQREIVGARLLQYRGPGRTSLKCCAWNRAPEVWRSRAICAFVMTCSCCLVPLSACVMRKTMQKSQEAHSLTHLASFTAHHCGVACNIQQSQYSPPKPLTSPNSMKS